MTDGPEPTGWSETLEPPPGGLAALRQRIARRERARRNLRRAAASGAVVFVLGALALWMARSEQTHPVSLPAGDDLLAIGLGLRQAQSEPATIAPSKRNSAALLRVPTTNERVAFYLVGALRAPEPES